MATAPELRRCFHCGEPIPPGVHLHVQFDGRPEAMCCRGCEAVAQTIIDYGLGRFYALRSEAPPRPAEDRKLEYAHLRTFDHPAIEAKFVVDDDAGSRSAALVLESVSCPACCWLIERRLAALDGAHEVNVNFDSARAGVRWDPQRLSLGQILRAVADLGYRAHPYDPAVREAVVEEERRGHLRRMAIAGLLGMQVMMISIALYFGDAGGMEPHFRDFFHWVALLLTLPVVLYSARPFFRNAWFDLRGMRTGMDVPVAAGILLALAGSVFATVTGKGAVYYDSIVMFVFILLTGRYVEFTLRRRAARHLDALHGALPALATRLVRTPDGAPTEESVPATELDRGDRLRVRPGEIVPADGIIESGASSFDESLITGEGLPHRRGPGEELVAGTTNVESPVEMRVTGIGADSVLARVVRLAEAARAERPALTAFADRIAGWFVAGVLVLGVCTAWYWWHSDPARWLPVTVSVLVVTCPCALALAAPAAVTAALGRLLREGILVLHGNALEALGCARTFVFDKTGTLTRGEPELLDVTALAPATREQCLAIAAALEAGSEHPLAGAVRQAGAGLVRSPARQLRNFPGEGIRGSVAGREFFIGTAAFIERMSGAPVPAGGPDAATRILLADSGKLLAIYRFHDRLRADVTELIAGLRRRGCRVYILSGDRQAVVDDLARRLDVDAALGDQGPQQKAGFLGQLRRRGDIVCMVGDGINDAPVLAGANVSIAMVRGTDVAKSHADIILMNERPGAIAFAAARARGTLAVMRENACWAVAYNLLALPAAAGGWITPWMAALGMSLSSLLVVLNSARLGRAPTRKAA